MFPVKKVLKSSSHAIDKPSRSNRIVVKGMKSTIARAERGDIILDPEFIQELKDKISELE
jgi:hypothetical protein